MEIFAAAKRSKTFNITEAGEAQPEVEFSRAEEENATILANAFEVGDRSLNTYSGSGQEGGITLTKQKSRQEEALESASKSAAELSQLISLTSMLQKQQHVVLSNCTRPPGLEPVGLALPLSQMVEMRRSQFQTIRGVLNQGNAALQTIAKKRQNSSAQLAKLRQHWSLSVYSPDAGASITVHSGRDTIAIDCGYCALPAALKPPSNSTSAKAASLLPAAGKIGAGVAGGSKTNSKDKSSSSLVQALEKTRPCLVPLLFGQDGIPSLPPDEQQRRMLSLCCVLVHPPSGQQIASVSLWDSVSSKVAAVCCPGPGGRLDTIHKHCLRRHHDSLSQLLFACLKNDAVALSSAPAGENSCRWVVAPPLAAAKVPSEPAQFLDAGELGALVDSEELSDSIDIASINRAAVTMLLSENIQAIITLQPMGAGGGDRQTRIDKGVARALLAVQTQLATAVHILSAPAPAPAAVGTSSSSSSSKSESFLALLVAGLKSALSDK